MAKLIRFAILFLLIPLFVWADVDTFDGTAITTSTDIEGTTGWGSVSGQTGSGGCSISNDSQLRYFDSANGTYSITNDPGYIAQELTPSNNITITGYKITVRDDSQTGNVIVRIETDDGGSPNYPTGSVVSGSSVSMAHGDIDDSTPTEYWFELASPIQLTGGVVYWLVVTNSTGMDFTIARNDPHDSGFSEAYAYNNGGGYSTSDKTLEFELWGCGTY